MFQAIYFIKVDIVHFVGVEEVIAADILSGKDQEKRLFGLNLKLFVHSENMIWWLP
jgi:hypothetical protein